MMLQILRYLDHHYEKLEKDMENLNISGLPLMSPMTLIVIISTYLIFVWIAPIYMKSRKPYNVKKFIMLYNVSQIILNGILTKFILNTIGEKIYISLFIMSAERQETFQMDVNVIWYWFVSRLWDLLDTVFITLKKKNNQISFLHVYHHASVCFIGWFSTKYIPVEQCEVFGFINCAVHVIMYCYYLLASLGPKYRKYLWCKKYITVIQLKSFQILYHEYFIPANICKQLATAETKMQFLVTILYLISTIIVKENTIKVASYILLVYAGSFLVLFSNFYNNAFIKKNH